MFTHFSSNSFYFLTPATLWLIHLRQVEGIQLLGTYVFLRPPNLSMSPRVNCWACLRLANAPSFPRRLDFRWRTPGDMMSPNWVALYLFVDSFPISIYRPPLFIKALSLPMLVLLKSLFDLKKSTFLRFKLLPELDGLLFMTSMNVST